MTDVSMRDVIKLIVKLEPYTPYKGYSISAIAVALREQHGFDWDIAFLCSWYAVNDDPPKFSTNKALSYMNNVKKTPTISKKRAEMYLNIYTYKRA